MEWGGICVVYRDERRGALVFVLSLSLCILIVLPLVQKGMHYYVERKVIEVSQ